MTVEWTKEQIVGIIKEIESRPAIWDSFSPIHRDKDKRRDAYQQVADIVKLPHDAVEKKFSNLRTQYCREINKAQTISNYKSKWFAYKYLSFLKKDILARRTRMFLVKNNANDQHNFNALNFLDENMLLNEEESNVNNNDEDLMNNCENQVSSLDNMNMNMNIKGEITEDNNVNSYSGMSSPVSLLFDNTSDINNDNDNDSDNDLIITPFEFNHSTIYPSISGINNNNNNKINKNKNKNKNKRSIIRRRSSASSNSSTRNVIISDEYELFGKSIAAQLRNITDRYAKSWAKLKIQNALFEAETLNMTTRNRNRNNKLISNGNK